MSAPIEIFSAPPKRPTPPTRKQKQLLMGKTKRQLMAGAGRYCFVTAAHLRALYYGKSLSFVQEHLAELFHAGYLLRTPYLRDGDLGKAAFVYTPSRNGWDFIGELGLPIPQRFRPGEETRKVSPHTLGITDFGVALERFCRDHPQVELAQFWHERLLPFVKISLPDGATQAVRPDAWLELHLRRGEKVYQRCYVYEHDRSSEYQLALRRKIRALLAYSQEPYRAQFGTSVITILFHVPTSQRRKLLLSWIQAELTQVQQTQRADLFRVSEADPLTFGPACWVDPVWFVPFQETPVPLLRLDAAQPGREPFPLRTHYLTEAEMARFYAASGSAVPLTRREASLED